MQSSDHRIQIQSAEIEQRNLVILWQDGHRSSFHPIWLRHQCECNRCGTSLNAVRGIRIHHIPEDISAKQLTHSVSEANIVWSNDDHHSTYSATWLRNHCYADSERKLRKHQPRLWDGSIARVPIADFNEARSDPKARLAMLQAVCDFGFCKIINVPTDASQSGQLIELVGEQRQTHYGTYTLSKKKAVDNVGDITAALDPHIDETYRLSHVGITIFQVLRPSSNGGASTLVDGFEAARSRRNQVTSLDKSNVMETGKLWRETVDRIGKTEFPNVELNHLLMDYALYAVGSTPRDFDVILADNLFGDLISDQIGMLAGSLGMLPSATLPCAARAGEQIRGGIYEPSHGTAPDISGKGIANPIATILSVAMMFQYAFARTEVAQDIENAVEQTLKSGIFTPDLGGTATTAEITAGVIAALR